MTDWMTDWLTDWMTDWLTDWRLNDWMTDWLTDWLTDTLTHYTHSLPAHSVNHSLTDWLPIKMTDWLTDSLTDWLTDRLTRWQTDWLIHPLTKSFIDWLPKWLTDWRTDWLPDRLSDRSKQLATSHLSGSLKAWCLFRHLVEWTDHACLLVESVGKPKTDTTVTCGFSKMQHAPGYRKLRKGWYSLKSDAKYASNKRTKRPTFVAITSLTRQQYIAFIGTMMVYRRLRIR